jgi:hypothetical protein
MRNIMGIGRGAGARNRVLRGDRRTDDDRPGFAEPLYHNRVARGYSRPVHRGPKRAFETGNIDGFLHGYRNSVKRTGRILFVELASAPQSAIDIKVDECAHNRIQLGDSRKATLCHLSCGTLVCPQERDQLDCRKSIQRFRYRLGSHGPEAMIGQS